MIFDTPKKQRGNRYPISKGHAVRAYKKELTHDLRCPLSVGKNFKRSFHATTREEKRRRKEEIEEIAGSQGGEGREEEERSAVPLTIDSDEVHWVSRGRDALRLVTFVG